MQLRLSFRHRPDDGIAPPDVCPHAGCGGRGFRLRQAVAKAVRGAEPGADTEPNARFGRRAVAARCTAADRHTVAAHRYTCLACGRTFRAYPAGIDRGQVPAGVKRLGAALRLLGLGFRDISRALTVLGIPLAKSQVHAAVSAMVGETRAPGIALLFTRIGFHDDADRGGPRAWIEIAGRRLDLWRAEDERGCPALVIVDVDWWTRGEINRWGRALLAEIGVDAEIEADRLDERRPRSSAR